MSVAVDMQALANSWETIIQLYDKNYLGLPKAVQTSVGKAISEWQNYYFGDREPEKAESWSVIASKTAETLMSAPVTSGKVASAVNAKAAASKPLPGSYVTGQSNLLSFTVPSISVPAWWLLLIPALPALYFLLKRKA